MFTGDSSVCSLEKSVDREKTLDRLKRKRKTSPVSYGLWLLNFFSSHPTATAICCLTLKDFLTLHNDFLKIWFFGNSSKTLIFAHEMIIFLGIAFCSLCSDKWQLWCGFRFPLKLVQFTLTVFYNSNIPGSISRKPLKKTPGEIQSLINDLNISLHVFTWWKWWFVWYSEMFDKIMDIWLKYQTV